MVEINLLPWRDSYKDHVQKKQKKGAILVLITTLVIYLSVNLLLSSYINKQRKYNALLTEEIYRLDILIEDIAALKKEEKSLISRLFFFRKLKNSSVLTIHLFDEISKIITEKSYLNKIKRSKEKITLYGIAESNQAISLLMRRIERNRWMNNPALISITNNIKSNRHSFELNFTLSQKKKVLN